MLELGKTIPEKYLNAMSSVMTHGDVKRLSIDIGVSESTAYGLYNGSKPVTKTNYEVIDALIKKAKEFLNDKLISLDKTKPDLELLKRSYVQLHQAVEMSNKEVA